MTYPAYQMDHDGRQWVLRRLAEVTNKETHEITVSERIVGYFPKFHQAVARMYELQVGDAVGNVPAGELLHIANAVAKAVEVRGSLAGIPDCKTCPLA